MVFLFCCGRGEVKSRRIVCVLVGDLSNLYEHPLCYCCPRLRTRTDYLTSADGDRVPRLSDSEANSTSHLNRLYLYQINSVHFIFGIMSKASETVSLLSELCPYFRNYARIFRTIPLLSELSP